MTILICSFPHAGRIVRAAPSHTETSAHELQCMNMTELIENDLMTLSVQVLHEIRPTRKATCTAEAATEPAAERLQLRIQEGVAQAAQKVLLTILGKCLSSASS